jgi:RHS repeat-associated protein
MQVAEEIPMFLITNWGQFVRPSRMGTLVLLLGTICVASQFCFGQDYVLQVGSPTFSTQLPIELGYTDTSSGNVHIEIPISVTPQRGSHQLVQSLVYDSRIWTQVQGTTLQWQPENIYDPTGGSVFGGWRFVTSVDMGLPSYNIATLDCPSGNGVYYEYYNFQLWDPDGTARYFPFVTDQVSNPTQCNKADAPTNNGFAIDSSGYHMWVTNYSTIKVYAPDGSKVYDDALLGHGGVVDPNGNYFVANEVSNGNITDTLGRTPVLGVLATNFNNDFYVYNSANGGSNFYALTTVINVSTAFGVSGVQEYSGTLNTLKSITLPDTSSYQFGYDSYGELNSITLPTKGVVTIGYANFTDATGGTNRWATSKTSGGGQWTYTPSVITTCSGGQVGCQQKTTVSKPSGDNAVYTFTLNNGAWNTEVQKYNGSISSGNLLATDAITWNFGNACTSKNCIGAQYIQRTLETVTVPLPGGTSATSATAWTYDNVWDANTTHLQQWKYYEGSKPSTPDRQTDSTYLTGSAYAAVNIINRPLSVVSCVPTGTPLSCTNSTKIGARTLYSYDQSGDLSNITGVVHHDDTNFGIGYTTRGNVTQIQNWVSGTTYLSSSAVHDTTGQVVSATDSAGHKTTYSYTDTFYTDNGQTPPAVYTPAAVTNSYLTTMTPPLSGGLSIGYYYNTGKVTFVRDANGNDSYSHFIDSNDRRTLDLGPSIGGIRSWTLYQYSLPAQGLVIDSYRGITDSSPSSSCTSCRHDQSVLDNLGRVSETILVSDPDGAAKVGYSYDTSGRLLSVTNPYRSTSDPTYGSDTSVYDGVDRDTSIKHSDNSVIKTSFGSTLSSGGNTAQLCASATYGIGYPALMIDESGTKGQSWRDAFGNLIEADEADSNNNLTIATCYLYDVADRPTQVASGAQTRLTSYDGLGRVTSTTEPESGTTTLYYTNTAGSVCSGASTNVCRAQYSNGITITYGYDAASRLTTKAYSDSTPSVTYFYDQTSYNGLTITNGKGRRTGMSDGSGTTAWSYDGAGRVIAERRTISGVTHTLSYSYNIDGSLASLTYPSGNKITYSYNNAARAISVIDSAHGLNFVQNVTYAPHGAVSGALRGEKSGYAGVTMTEQFNNRLQPTLIQGTGPSGTIFSIAPGFGAPVGSNGTVVSYVDNRTSGRGQNYSYESLNRIATAKTVATTGTSCWGQQFGYDRWGNLLSVTPTQCSTLSLNVTVSATTNQITTSGFTYDSAGRMTNDAVNAYTWDAENEITSAGGITYKYDGNHLRVSKSTGPFYWRSVAGGTLAETDTTGSTTNANYFEYVFFGGQRVAQRATSGQILHYFTDQIASTRVIFNEATLATCFDADYTPFGYEVDAISTTCPQNYKFAGFERDPETQLDYAMHRYYSSRLGRFLSPDFVRGAVVRPQSLNRYSYVQNDPCTLVDPLGLDPQCVARVLVKNPGNLPQEDVQAIEQQIRNLLSSSDVGISFVNNGSYDYTLNLSDAIGTEGGLDLEAVDVGKTDFVHGVSNVFVPTITVGYDTFYLSQTWGLTFGMGSEPSWLVSLDTAIGTVAGHELYHAITTQPDSLGPTPLWDLMGIQANFGDKNDPAGAWLAMFGKPPSLRLTDGEKAALLSGCKNPPKPVEPVVAFNESYLFDLFNQLTSFLDLPPLDESCFYLCNAKVTARCIGCAS